MEILYRTTYFGAQNRGEASSVLTPLSTNTFSIDFLRDEGMGGGFEMDDISPMCSYSFPMIDFGYAAPFHLPALAG